MLVITRKIGQTVFIGNDVEVTVTRIDPRKVRIAITAPKEIPIFRGELCGKQPETIPQPARRKR